MSAFIDGGQVRGDGQQPEFESFRYSAGLALSWASPIGPLKFSLAKPLNAKEGDKIQRFQFILGSTF
jgi:outer membrane protein insertion porin family